VRVVFSVGVSGPSVAVKQTYRRVFLATAECSSIVAISSDEGPPSRATTVVLCVMPLHKGQAAVPRVDGNRKLRVTIICLLVAVVLTIGPYKLP
jgi:hypothetical protein